MLLHLIKLTLLGTLLGIGLGMTFGAGWLLVLGLVLGGCLPALLAVNFLVSR